MGTSATGSIIPAGMLDRVASQAAAAGVFGEVKVEGARLSAAAKAPAAPAWYRLFEDAGRVWVAFVTADRWLSHSIEADLLHTGDKLDELIHEELVEQGIEALPEPNQHFRDEDKLFTFRTALPREVYEDVMLAYLLAYEAALRELGDVDAG